MIGKLKIIFVVHALIFAAFGCSYNEPDLPPPNLEERNKKVEEISKIETLLKSASPIQAASALLHPDSRVRVLAARRLEQIGPPAADAVPNLTRTLKDQSSRVRVAAAIALGRIQSKEALMPLIESLAAGDFETRLWAWKAIKMYPEDAVQLLISHLGSQSPIKSLSYKDGYGNLVSIQNEIKDRIASLGQMAVPILISSLRNDDSWIRIGASQILGAIGVSASASGPELIQLLQTGYSNERTEAARALGKIGDFSPETKQALTYAANDTDKSVARAAGQALKEIENNKKRMQSQRRGNPMRRQSMAAPGS